VGGNIVPPRRTRLPAAVGTFAEPSWARARAQRAKGPPLSFASLCVARLVLRPGTAAALTVGLLPPPWRADRWRRPRACGTWRR
jgi:hypothetical protein